jgi:NTE family protein
MNFLAESERAAGSGPALAVREKVINLALQGGGSHGAFTWGVLDRLLEDERLAFEGITATSAGAVNAVVLADGFAVGGREEARKALRRFWQKTSEQSSRSVFKPSWFDKVSPEFGLDHSPGYVFMETLAYFASPYQSNPFNFNPLRDLLQETVDFERVRRQRAIKLFLSATDVETAKVKIFPGEDLHVDHVLASTCLPLMMHAVEVDGRYYWDGGFAGNPAIFPLIYGCEARDIVMVHITPAERPGVPRTSVTIMNRMQEISFNTSLIREMRSVAFVTKLIDDGKAEGRRMFMHLIEAEDLIRELSASSRLNGDWDFLQHLHKLGRERAEQWLTANFDDLGVKSTVDLQAKYF